MISFPSISKWYQANHGAKDELKDATPIGIMLERSISYTLASFGRHCLLYFLS